MVILLNKPYGVVCQFSGAGATLRSYVPVKNVYAAGRLDADSEGLVVLTDDGALQHRISNPRHKMPKKYWVQVDGTVTSDAIAHLRNGVQLSDFKTRSTDARIVPPPDWLWERVPPIRVRKTIATSWLQLVLHEGRNRQIRRMTAAVGFPTLRLIRTSVGPWALEGMQPGQWREVAE
jgi:23S rRNA pseudouridine2457 synthase